MEQVKYTAEQLADRFMDLRAIENTMGRYVNSLLLKQEDTILHDYWSRFENDICYGTNEGWYTGRRAVPGVLRGHAPQHGDPLKAGAEAVPRFSGG